MYTYIIMLLYYARARKRAHACAYTRAYAHACVKA